MVFGLTWHRIHIPFNNQWSKIDMKLKEVERVLYFENFIVIEPGLTGLKKKPTSW